jgi:predicted amidophosphoribosyltransferase
VLAATLIFGMWFVGFIILSIIWFMTRPTRRLCPVCGSEARKGQTICKKCGHNFARAAVPFAASEPAPVPIDAVGVVRDQTSTGVLSERNESSMAAVERGASSCPSCGQRNDIADRFCSGCGTRLVTQPAS